MEKKRKNPRNYNCKDEELPAIAGFALTSVKRDQEKFMDYSPKYNEEGLNSFEQDIAAVEELINPKLETAELKLITAGLYATMNDMFDKGNRIEGYISMSKKAIPISAKDFGITALKQRAKAKDAEGTLSNARLVNANIKKYREELTIQGLTDEMANTFEANIGSISDDNKKQYDITNNRKAIVQANLDMLNGLYGQITDICRTGKILFRGDAGKMKEYTFSELMKNVRNVSKSSKKNDETDEG